jgi:hypothetical protein
MASSSLSLNAKSKRGPPRTKKLRVPRAPKSVEKPSSRTTQEIFDYAAQHAALCLRHEVKSASRKLTGDGPTELMDNGPDFAFVPTKDSKLALTMMHDVFGDRHFRLPITAVVTMSSSGAGLVNSVLSNSSLGSNATFLSLATIFNEFFVHGFTVLWQPVSLNNYPLTGVTATSVSSLPLGVAVLQNAVAGYTNIGFASGNYQYAHQNTGKSFTAHWTNIESPNSTVLTSVASGPLQTWALIADVSSYSGQLQFISGTAPPLAVSQILGSFSVVWDVSFRAKRF